MRDRENRQTVAVSKRWDHCLSFSFNPSAFPLYPFTSWISVSPSCSILDGNGRKTVLHLLHSLTNARGSSQHNSVLQYLQTSTRDLYNPSFKLVWKFLNHYINWKHITHRPLSNFKTQTRLLIKVRHAFRAYVAVRKKCYTLYDASLINCLAGIFQMAGTVMTHLTSALSKSAPDWSLSSCIQW